MEQEVCKAHSGLDTKLDNIGKTLESMDERLLRIESKVEPISTIGHIADTNRKWLVWITGFLTTYLMKLIIWR